MKPYALALVLIASCRTSHYSNHFDLAQDPRFATGMIVAVSPSPEIKYAYAYYIPSSITREAPVQILYFAHGSSGSATTSYADLIQETLNREYLPIVSYAEKAGYVLAMAVLPRDYTRKEYPYWKLDLAHPISTTSATRNTSPPISLKFHKRS